MKRIYFVIGLMFVVTTGAIVWYVRDVSAPVVVPTRSAIEIRADWKTGVESIIQAYEGDRDAVKASQALLRLTVPSDGRDVHLMFALALEAARANKANATTDWQKAVTQFRSLP
ncbi:hypothetical protein KBB27_03725 [Patescibacteria group bacterium]|nr:hypothetical protein [Patescibacteria group bacterium]